MADINFPLDHPLYGEGPGMHATPAMHLGNMGLEVALPDGTFVPINDPQVMQHYMGRPGQRQHPGPVTVRSNSGNPEYDADALFAAKRAVQHGGTLPGLPPKPLPGPEGAPMLHKMVNLYREGLSNGQGVVKLPPAFGGPQQVFDPSDTVEPGEEGYAPQIAPQEAEQQRQPMSAKSAWYEEDEGWTETSAWHEANDVEAQKPEGNIEYNQSPHLEEWYEDDPRMEMAEHHARDFSEEERDEDAENGDALPDGSFPIENEEDLKNAERLKGKAKDPAKAERHIKERAKELGVKANVHTALGERQMDGGVGGQPTDQWNPQVNGPNADMAPSADNANNSPEQEVALEMWVNFAVQELSRGEDPLVIAPKMEQAGCPPHLVQQAIQLAQQKQEDNVSNDAGQDAFSGQPTVPAQTTPGEQGGVSLPGQTMSSIHREIVERTEEIEDRKANREVIAAGLWGEELEQPDPLSVPLSPVDELQSFIDSFEPLDEAREASVKARIANLKLLRQSVRQVDLAKLSATDQILLDNLDVDAQLGLLNLSSHLDEFLPGHLMDDGSHRPTYHYDGYRVGGEFAQPLDESEEAAEILVAEMPDQLRHDDAAVTAIALNAHVLPSNALKAASRYAVETVEQVADEDEIDDGPAEALFTT